MGIDPRQHRAHVQMWGAVIKLAIRDAERLAEMRNQPDIFKWEEKKYGRLIRADPWEFLGSEWFREICYMTGANPDKILAGIMGRGVLADNREKTCR